MEVLNLYQLHYRTRDRIKNLGEVFTPEQYVADMLDLLAKEKSKLWSNEKITFFEPCCGHGNIVVQIYKRRLEAIYQKSLKKLNKEAPYYAVANALNTLWAIDIDNKNIENCRTRILSVTLNFLRSNIGPENYLLLFTKRKDFFAHIISATKWHIKENETMSALSSKEDAQINANKTKSGAKWFSKNGQHEINFDLTWVNFYNKCKNESIIPLNYEKAILCINSISSGCIRGFDGFSFVRVLMNKGELNMNNNNIKKSKRLLEVSV